MQQCAQVDEENEVTTAPSQNRSNMDAIMLKNIQMTYFTVPALCQLILFYYLCTQVNFGIFALQIYSLIIYFSSIGQHAVYTNRANPAHYPW